MKLRELPIYTHQICKGNALKIKACRLFSYSKKEKETMKNICDKLELSNSVYKDANKLYYEYLKTVVNTTGLDATTKYPIAACVYLSTIKNREYRYKKEISKVADIAPSTISNWAQKISFTLHLNKHLYRKSINI